MKRVLITGGAGYMGSHLVPHLLNQGYLVTVLDTFWFGDHFIPQQNLSKIKGDIRHLETVKAAMIGQDAVIHLACISNDPSVELDESLSTTINLEAFEPLVKVAKAYGVQRFIYCSSSSVYGISDAPDVTEDHPLVPLTLYNRYKGMCEPLLFRNQDDDFTCVTIRPSTHCGYSQRQRLDLAVNILTNLAFNKGIITVFGGEQKRPNVHINDMVRVYDLLLIAPKEQIAGQIFNVGEKNYSIMELAQIVQTVVADWQEKSIPIEVKPIKDVRSYQVNSDKIKRVLGFETKYTVQDAVSDLCRAFSQGMIPNPDDPIYYNVQQMRAIMPEVYKGTPPSAFDASKGVLSEMDLLRGAGQT